MIPCSRSMIQVSVHVLRFLRVYDGSVEEIAAAGDTSIHSVRRSMDALRTMLPIEHTRYDDAGERVDLWKLGRELGEGEAEAIAASLFLEPEAARALLKRARVTGVEPYIP